MELLRIEETDFVARTRETERGKNLSFFSFFVTRKDRAILFKLFFNFFNFSMCVFISLASFVANNNQQSVNVDTKESCKL